MVVSMNKIIKKKILKTIYELPVKKALKDMILFEGYPEFRGNTKAVFDEMICQNINDKYEMIWAVSNPERYKDIHIHNTRFVFRENNLKGKLLFLPYNLSAKVIIDSNRFVPKRFKSQFRVHLTHGATIKYTKEYSSQIGHTDYVVQASKFFTEATKDLYEISERQIFTSEMPRTDVFFKEETYYIYPDIPRQKTVIWMPTYRNHNNVKSVYSTGESFPYGVPCIGQENELQKLNQLLNEKDTLLLIKLHPAEKLISHSFQDLSHIVFMKDEDFLKDNKDLYDVLKGTDALITDYSSVYYDYLLLNKPICIAAPDQEQFRKTVKLMFDSLEENFVGFYAYTFDDICQFICDTANGIDVKKGTRLDKMHLYNEYCDGKSAKRIVELIKKHL